MKIAKFIIGIILVIVLVTNFQKIVSIGNILVDKVYELVVTATK